MTDNTNDEAAGSPGRLLARVIGNKLDRTTTVCVPEGAPILSEIAGGGIEAVARTVSRTVLGTRIVDEDILDDGRGTRLPVATVWDSGGDRAAVRVYYSSWPHTGVHRVRPPLLALDPSLAAPDVVGRYQRALADGDLDAVLDCFDDDGEAREPAGGDHRHRGREGLRRFYALLCKPEGGIPLEHCSLTDDGVRCAIEYNVTRWTGVALPPQAGVAVYERAPSGLLASARIYDDVTPPSSK